MTSCCSEKSRDANTETARIGNKSLLCRECCYNNTEELDLCITVLVKWWGAGRRERADIISQASLHMINAVSLCF